MEKGERVKRVAAGALAVCAIMVAQGSPAVAASDARLAGWIEIWGEGSDGDHEFSNPETNFSSACSRGNNGWADWMRKGARFPILNGTGDKVGAVKVTASEWVSNYGLKGICRYFVDGRVKQSNFYCLPAPNGYTWEIGSGRKQFVRVDEFIMNVSWPTPYRAKTCGG